MGWLSAWETNHGAQQNPRPPARLCQPPTPSDTAQGGWPHDITVPTTCDCPRRDAGGPGHFPAFLWVTVAAHRGAPAGAVPSLLEVLPLQVMAPSFIALGSTLGAESALLAVC